jgi:hypothetical protein
MAYQINQEPAYNKIMPVGTDWIYTVDSTNATGGNYKFKYFVDVYIGNLGGTFRVRLKFSPNENGVGIVNLSDIYEQYVKPSQLGSVFSGIESGFKGVQNIAGSECPIHLIDKCSLNTGNMALATLGWGEEYSTNSTDAPTEYPGLKYSTGTATWNGMAYNNEDKRVAGEYGIDVGNWNGKDYIPANAAGRYLTNAPKGNTVEVGQHVRLGDYGTLAWLNGDFGTPASRADTVIIQFFNTIGTMIQQSTYALNATNGAFDASYETYVGDGREGLQFIGSCPGNLVGAGISIPAATVLYIVMLFDGASLSSYPMQYHIQEDDCKGYETIRLTWLNKFGTWDYYNFTKKSERSTDVKRTHYNQVKGNWAGETFVKDGYERGLTTLHTKVLEKITVNSDWFRTDKEAAWLEELFISPKVYILESYDALDTAPAEYGKYLTPVQITNKKYERYTRANDKVAQYSVDLEYAINKRVQRA